MIFHSPLPSTEAGFFAPKKGRIAPLLPLNVYKRTTLVDYTVWVRSKKVSLVKGRGTAAEGGGGGIL